MLSYPSMVSSRNLLNGLLLLNFTRFKWTRPVHAWRCVCNLVINLASVSVSKTLNKVAKSSKNSKIAKVPDAPKSKYRQDFLDDDFDLTSPFKKGSSQGSKLPVPSTPVAKVTSTKVAKPTKIPEPSSKLSKKTKYFGYEAPDDIFGIDAYETPQKDIKPVVEPVLKIEDRGGSEIIGYKHMIEDAILDANEKIVDKNGNLIPDSKILGDKRAERKRAQAKHERELREKREKTKVNDVLLRSSRTEKRMLDFHESVVYAPSSFLPPPPPVKEPSQRSKLSVRQIEDRAKKDESHLIRAAKLRAKEHKKAKRKERRANGVTVVTESDNTDDFIFDEYFSGNDNERIPLSYNDLNDERILCSVEATTTGREISTYYLRAILNCSDVFFSELIFDNTSVSRYQFLEILRSFWDLESPWVENPTELTERRIVYTAIWLEILPQFPTEYYFIVMNRTKSFQNIVCPSRLTFNVLLHMIVCFDPSDAYNSALYATVRDRLNHCSLVESYLPPGLVKIVDEYVGVTIRDMVRYVYSKCCYPGAPFSRTCVMRQIPEIANYARGVINTDHKRLVTEWSPVSVVTESDDFGFDEKSDVAVGRLRPPAFDERFHRAWTEYVKKRMGDDDIEFGFPKTSLDFKVLVNRLTRAFNKRVGDFSNTYSPMISTICSWLSYIWLMSRSRSLNYISAVTYLYVSGFVNMEDFPTRLVGTSALVVLAKAFGPASSVQTESLSSDINDLSYMLDKVLDSPAVGAFRDIIVSITAFQYFPKDVAKDVYKFFGKPKSMCVLDLVKLCLTSTSKIIKVFELTSEGIPLTTALLADDPVETAIANSLDTLAYADRIYDGLPVEGYIDRHEYLQRLEKNFEFLNSLKLKMPVYSPAYVKINNVKRSLNMAIGDVRNSMGKTLRIPPVAIVLTGPPGIGKSGLLMFITNIMSKIKGREYKNSHIYNRTMASEYWEGYNPGSHPYIHFSEAGALKGKIVESQGDPVLMEILSLIDSQPFPCNMASVDLKGKTYAYPELVVIDTNNEGLNLEFLFTAKAAAERRLIYVMPKVKKEFQKSGTQSLDNSVECKDIFDKWTFSVVTKEPVNNNVSKPHLHLDHESDKSDIHALTDVLTKMFTDHIKKNTIVREDFLTALKEGRYGNVVSESDSVSFDFRRWFRISYNFVRQMFNYIFQFFVFFSMMIGVFLSDVLFTGLNQISAFLHRSGFVFNETNCTIFISVILVFWLIGYTGVLLSVWFVACFFSLRVFTTNVVRKQIRDASENVRTYSRYHYRRFIAFVIRDASFDWLAGPNAMKIAASVLAVSTILIGLYQSFKTNTVKATSEATSDFQTDSKVNDEINTFEDSLGCGPPTVRIKAVNDIWNIQSVRQTAIYRGGLSEFKALVYRNVRKYRLVSDDNKKSASYLLGLCDNIAIINTHSSDLLKNGGSLKVSATHDFNNDTNWRLSRVTASDIVDVGNDISLVKLSGVQFRNITMHIFAGDKIPQFFTAHLGTQKLSASRLGNPLQMSNTHLGVITIGDAILYELPEHKIGLCGLPLIGECDGGLCVIGIHCAGDSLNNNAFGAFINYKVVDSASRWPKPSLMNVMSESQTYQTLTIPDKKSPFRHEVFHGVDLLGRTPGVATLNNKSKLVPTKIEKEYILDLFYRTCGFVPNKVFAPPMMRPTMLNGEYFSPYNIALRGINRVKPGLDKELLLFIVDKIVVRIVNRLKENGVTTLSPYTVETAVNGAIEDQYFRRVNVSTSAGHGWDGKKSKYLPIVTEEPLIREPVENLKERIVSILNSYKGGESANVVFKAQLKDEPREIEKVRAGKTRVFYMSPVDALIVSRMILGPFYTLMIQYRAAFCTAVGINMHTEAKEIYNMLNDFSPNILEGDYGKFDQSMPFDIGHAACTVVHNVLRELGYNETALTIARGLLSDILFLQIEMIKDVFVAPGVQPSGKYATTEDNSLRGLILLMYFFYSNFDRSKDFFEFIAPITNGDDVLAAVKDSVADVFNNVTYSKFVKEVYNMEFTTSSKGEVSDKFLNPQTMTFLKRNFRIRDGHVIAPLDMDSILRSLIWTLPSSVDTPEEQMLSTISSACREMYFHLDSRQYQRFRDELVGLFCEFYNVKDTVSAFKLVPTYDTITTQLWPSENNPVEGGRRDSLDDEDKTTLDTRVVYPSLEMLGIITVSQPSEAKDCSVYTETDNGWSFSKNRETGLKPAEEKIFTFDDNIYKLREQAKEEIEKLRSELQNIAPPAGQMSYKDVRMTEAYIMDPIFHSSCDYYYSLLGKLEGWEATYSIMSRRIHSNTFNNIKTESDNGAQTDGPISNTVAVTRENVVDVGGDPPDETKIGTSYEDLGLRPVTDLNLDDFFNRPAKISTFTIPIATNTDVVLPIWDLYTSLPYIRAKLKNYAFFKANIHVRVSISGTPFHSGKVICAYYPYPLANSSLTVLKALGTRRIPKLKYFSQAPGVKIMDVRKNTPMDFHFPFISPRYMARLFNKSSSALSDATSYEEIAELGLFHISTLNNVRCVSSTPTAVSVEVYAWLTDVELGCPTGTVITVTTESDTSDERKTGPVEHIASRASEITESLSMVPVIGPYAVASSIALKAFSSIAALFGWSYPVTTTKPVRVKQEPYQNGMNVIGVDTGKRMTLDPKQELTIDPRMFGTDEDEMTISFIASTESLLSTFTWSTSASPYAPIWTSVVHPRVLDISGANGNALQQSALSFSATPFEYWRGTITFKFQFVASNFDRGKFMIFFEPNIMHYTLVTSNVGLTKQHVKIIDLQETQEVEFCVKWDFPSSWARNLTKDMSKKTVHSNIDTLNLWEYWDCVNGFIGVCPLTRLQTPDNSSIEVNVFIKSDDIAYNGFTSKYLPSSRVITESNNVWTESDNLLAESVTCYDLNPNASTMKGICEQHFGERPVSFRSLLKRFATNKRVTFASNAVAGNKSLGFTTEIFPRRNLIPGAASTANGDLFSYLSPAYMGMRGSFRKRYRYLGLTSSNIEYQSRVIIGLAQPTESTPIDAVSWFLIPAASNNCDGFVTFVPFTNAGIEVEIPFYAQTKFAFSCSADPYNVNIYALPQASVRAAFVTIDVTGSAAGGSVVEEFATGEDFMFGRWLGSPPETYA